MDLIAKSLMGSYSKGPIDPYFEYTTLLLRGNGLNGAQNGRSGPAAAYRDGTFLDSSSNNFTITRNGNASQGTFSPFSQTGWSVYFDGTTDYLTIATSTAFSFGTGDFTVEAWVFKQTAVNKIVFDARASVATTPWSFGVDDSNYPYFYDGTSLTSNIAILNNTWNHIAATRISGTLKVFVNGVQGFSQTITTNLDRTAGIFIGARVTDAIASFDGYISNARIVKGTALYTTNFTPSTSPLTSVSGTSLLTCQSNRFIDNSTNNFTITRNGDTRVVAFSPFNPTASWSAATYGGSGYFDGSGDYLSVADNAALELGSSSFCIEVMYYPTSLPAAAIIFTKQPNPSTDYGFRLGAYNGVLRLYISSGNTSDDIVNGTTFGTLQLNTWNHIAIYRVGTAIYGSLNGTITTLNASTSLSVWNNTAPWVIGATNTGGGGSSGYFSDWRIVIGSGVYTSSSAPFPTAPLTAITNTSLLLNFTNAGIYDATSKNDLETVGNAQISTTQSKWGGSSMSFDGTGDYLQNPDTELLEFGSGDFTIETWVRFNALPSSSAYYALISKFDNSTLKSYNFYVYNNAGTYQLYFTYTTNGSTNINPVANGITVTTNTWYHYAVSRSGVNLRLFIDGTQVGSTYNIATDTIFGGTYPVQVGASTGANTLNGYLQDVRVTKGYARYTANFTPPTAAFPTL